MLSSSRYTLYINRVPADIHLYIYRVLADKHYIYRVLADILLYIYRVQADIHCTYTEF